MKFGMAIENMRNGLNLQRAGWNGKGMYVFLHTPFNTDKNPPYFCMVTATGATQSGWLASQADMLAEDWLIAT